MKEKTILHIDANNFFVSCELLMNPSLRGKSVCVLSNNDGCVVSRSYEAKKIGIPMGIPYFMARVQFKDTIFLSANFTLYHELSARLMQMLYNYSDKVDVYSIDEAFLDVSEIDLFFNLPFLEVAKKIKSDIESNLGVSVSVGISSSKMLAKLATHKAKMGQGTYVIEKNKIHSELERVKIEELWGVGKNISRTLKSYGIFYANQILEKEDNFYRTVFGKKGVELKYELSGISVIPLTGIALKPKSIQKTRAFPSFSDDKSYIRTEIMMHLHNVCKKLRHYNLKTSVISVMLRTKDFRVLYMDEKLDCYTNSELLLAKTVEKLFNSIFKTDIIYRSSGVMAFNLSDTTDYQLNLFENKHAKKCERIAKVLDKIEDKYGAGVLLQGDNGIKSIQEKHRRK